ncbi:MAG: hypothetical protein RL761_244 [Pseudomonadota bacterium]|jgi:hypothetical protein
MLTSDMIDTIKTAIDSAPRNAYVGELHLQILKYSDRLKTVSGKDFCEALKILPAYSAEFSKMIKIAPRLKSAGLDESKI